MAYSQTKRVGFEINFRCGNGAGLLDMQEERIPESKHQPRKSGNRWWDIKSSSRGQPETARGSVWGK